MIVNTETRDALDMYGRPSKEIVLSYINKQGKISYLTYVIPAEQMYQWSYVRRGQNPDPYYRSWDGKPVIKTPNNGYVSDIRLHEILIDLIKANPQVEAIYELNEPDTFFCDIEVAVDDSGFPGPNEARNPINTISWVHNEDVYVLGRAKLSAEDIEDIQKKIDEHCTTFTTDYKFTYVYFDNEYSMLDTFFREYLYPATCVTGWNFFGYDWLYLYNRAKNLGINIDYLSPTGDWMTYKLQNSADGKSVRLPKHKLMYDYLEIYVKWDRAISPKEVNKLDWVAEKALGVKKVAHSLGFKELWEQEPANYVFYNAIDSVLVREIDNKIKTSGAFFGLANLTHVDALTAFSPVRTLQIVQAEYLYKEGKVFPNAKRDKKENDGYEGAFVFEPTAGIYKNVIALDFASLYPSTMMQFNISPETFITKDKSFKPNADQIKCTSGAVYSRTEKGFIPKILDDYYSRRKAYKKEMMIAIDERGTLEHIYEQRFGIAMTHDG